MTTYTLQLCQGHCYEIHLSSSDSEIYSEPRLVTLRVIPYTVCYRRIWKMASSIHSTSLHLNTDFIFVLPYTTVLRGWI